MMCNLYLDLGISISSDLKPSAHCSRIAANAFGIASVLLKGLQASDLAILIF